MVADVAAGAVVAGAVAGLVVVVAAGVEVAADSGVVVGAVGDVAGAAGAVEGTERRAGLVFVAVLAECFAGVACVQGNTIVAAHSLPCS